MNIYVRYEDYVDILGHHKTGLVLGVISVHFRVFSLGQCTDSIWEYFWGCYNFKYFWGMPDIPDIF